MNLFYIILQHSAEWDFIAQLLNHIGHCDVVRQSVSVNGPCSNYSEIVTIFVDIWIVFVYCLITFSCTLLLLSLLSDRQVKMINILTRFIEYHYKSIVSIIRAKHVLTLHLSTQLTEESSLLAAAARRMLLPHYVILPGRVIPQFLKLWS